ncbi:MAG: hypothetical protein COA78_27695 [Blastopirellula sp.]|nr:MAG: hypothetical protein COA78_27695 [Blastopirellula sp.]
MGTIKPQFFPVYAFSSDPNLDQFESKYVADLLMAAEEKSIYSSQPNRKTYRFTKTDQWIGTISIVPMDKTAALTTKHLTYNGQQLPGIGSYTLATKTLNQYEWNRFNQLFQQSDFWNLTSSEEPQGLDGYHWICEVCDEDQYHLVNRWCPRQTGYASLCDFVFKLTQGTQESSFWERLKGR